MARKRLLELGPHFQRAVSRRVLEDITMIFIEAGGSPGARFFKVVIAPSIARSEQLTEDEAKKLREETRKLIEDFLAEEE